MRRRITLIVEAEIDEDSLGTWDMNHNQLGEAVRSSVKQLFRANALFSRCEVIYLPVMLPPLELK